MTEATLLQGLELRGQINSLTNMLEAIDDNTVAVKVEVKGSVFYFSGNEKADIKTKLSTKKSSLESQFSALGTSSPS